MRRLNLFSIALTLFLAMTAQQGCRRETSPNGDAAARPNVIIVLVDTLRADHMSTYGYSRPTTPFIDRLARESVVFERARSQASCTFPSVNSILTSRYPFDFNAQQTGEMGIPEKHPAIAEILRDRGYRTIAVSASPIVRNTPSEQNPGGGFGSGFDVFDESCLWDDAECVNLRAEELLGESVEPFFLYLHYMDPHGHYAPPDTYEKQFAGAYDGHDFIAAGDHNPIADMLYADGPEFEITDNDIQHLFDLYDDEIRYFDGQFETFIEGLRDRGTLENSLLVFTSDHGEEFLEHGHVGHCRGVWDTLTRVPLLLRFPGMVGGERVDSAVQLVDIVPTLLDALEIDPGSLSPEGTTLGPLLDGGQPTRDYAFSDQSKFRAADDGRWQLILDGVDSTATLFDLRNDPLQQKDVFKESHPEVDRLDVALNTWLDESGQWVNFDKALAASKAKEEELRALGYLR
jgi:arylsulfatase A-like enzyme